jgi:hypothetical protein
MYNKQLKKDLQALADAQLAFELNGWDRIDSVQKDRTSNSSAWGTVYSKNGKRFYLNIESASKAQQAIQRID